MNVLTFCDKQMENNVIHSFIRVFLDHWIGVYDDTKKKSKQKIMTKIKKKRLSRKSSYPWKSVVCVASKHFPHQKNEFNSIPYASFDATGTVHVIPLCLHKSFKCIEGVISTWKMTLLWIIRTSDSEHTRMITLFWVTSWFYKTIYGATPSGQGRQSYHPLFILSIMMRPTSI